MGNAGGAASCGTKQRCLEIESKARCDVWPQSPAKAHMALNDGIISKSATASRNRPDDIGAVVIQASADHFSSGLISPN